MGHTGSNSVESFNARAIAYRKIPLSLALMPAARLMAEMHNTANMNADEHQGALPPRVEEDAVTMRDQAANIPASHVKHVGTNMYQVHSARNNDVFDVEITHDEILCSPKERELLTKLLSMGLHDLFNDYDYPSQTFTWWDYRGGAFQRNIGYRIDLVLGSKSIKKRCSEYFIDKKTRHKSWCLAEPRTSDHVPVRVLLD